MLTGEQEGALRATGDTIQLDVGSVVDQVRQRLVDAGFDKAAAIPDSDRTVTLFHTDELGKAQDAMRLLDILGTWLPVITVALAALAVWTAPGHRVMLLITALGLSLMMVVLLVALAVVRRVYLDAVPPAALPPDAASAIFDTFLRFLRDSTRTLLVVFLATALAAYLYGPGRVARRVRALAGRGTTAAGRALRSAGLSTGRTGRRLAAHPRWTSGIVLGAGALALLLWNRPTVGAVVARRRPGRGRTGGRGGLRRRGGPRPGRARSHPPGVRPSGPGRGHAGSGAEDGAMGAPGTAEHLPGDRPGRRRDMSGQTYLAYDYPLLSVFSSVDDVSSRLLDDKVRQNQRRSIAETKKRPQRQAVLLPFSTFHRAPSSRPSRFSSDRFNSAHKPQQPSLWKRPSLRS